MPHLLLLCNQMNANVQNVKNNEGLDLLCLAVRHRESILGEVSGLVNVCISQRWCHTELL